MKNTIPTVISVLCVFIVASFAAYKALGHSEPPPVPMIGGAPPMAAAPGSAGSGYTTVVDEKKANELFHADHGKTARHTTDGKSLGDSWALVANCEDGSKVWAPYALYVRARADSGGYTRRKTDPEPIVVPLSYDWCAP